MTDTDLHRGARIGTRIAMLVSQALIHTHTKLLDVKHRLAVMIFNTISNEISDEVDMTIGPLLKRMAEAYEEGGEAAGLMEFMAHGRGQFKAIVGSNATAQSLLWALGAVISNELAPATYGYIGANPHLIPDSGTVAGLAAGGHVSDGAALDAIRKNGLFDYWGQAMIEASKSYPSLADLADMMHKQAISQGEAVSIAHKSGVDPAIANTYLSYSFQDVSYQDAALAYLRGEVSLNEVYLVASRQGLNATNVDVFLSSIGEPPSTTDLMEAFRRGIIGQGEVDRGIKQSRMRNEWIPMLTALRYSPMPIADAVNAVVQNHIPYGEGQRIADENGLQPGQFDTLYQTAGAPLSRTELNELYNRGLIGSDVVLQGLRESRLKDKYGTDAFALRQRLLEPRSLGEAVNNGAMAHDTAIHKAMENGFSAEDAGYLVNAASNRKMQSYREKVIGQAERLYAEGGMSAEQLTAIMESMGHSAAEARIVVQAADLEREQRAFQAATNAIRNKLIAHHIDSAAASRALDAIGMHSMQRDYLLQIWQLEESVNTRVLTEAQIVKAVKKQLITPDQGLERLMAEGYSGDDAVMLLDEI